MLELAEGCGFTASETGVLIDDARRRVGEFCAARVTLPTLREICPAVLIETLSFEFMLSRCSATIAATLSERYAIPKTALRWFELYLESVTILCAFVDLHGSNSHARNLLTCGGWNGFSATSGKGASRHRP